MQLLHKIIIVIIKSCLILGNMNCNDLVFLLPVKIIVPTTTLIIVRTHVTRNTLIPVQLNEKC